jgi:hypothetical protein
MFLNETHLLLFGTWPIFMTLSSSPVRQLRTPLLSLLPRMESTTTSGSIPTLYAPSTHDDQLCCTICLYHNTAFEQNHPSIPVPFLLPIPFSNTSPPCIPYHNSTLHPLPLPSLFLTQPKTQIPSPPPNRQAPSEQNIRVESRLLPSDLSRYGGEDPFWEVRVGSEDGKRIGRGEGGISLALLVSK